MPIDETCPKTRAVGARLAKALHAYLSGDLTDARLIHGLRRLARDIEGDAVLKAPTAPLEATHENALRGLFGFWQQKMTLPKAKFTAGRRRAVLARLAEGYTVGQIRRAIAACSASEWHCGQNDRKTAYNDLTLICRSGEQVEKFLAMADAHGAPEADDNPELRKLQREASSALKEGRTDDYNRANARLVAFTPAWRTA
jgi:hypothetical protein